MASTYLSRTQTAGTSTKKFTFSAWVKRAGQLGASYSVPLFGSYHDDSNRGALYCYQDQILTYFKSGGSTQFLLKTNAKYRDVHGWYHIVMAVDTTQSTANDRVKLYVNGEQIAVGDLETNTQPSQNADFATVGVNSRAFEVGRMRYGSTPDNILFDGSMSHVHFCDGYTYASSDFGETDSTTGIWKPKTAPSVTYGTNGFFLKFENSGAMGTDSSGNSNTFTVNGSMTQLIDTPSNVFATMNPLQFNSSAETFSDGNNTLVSTGGGSWTTHYGFSTLAMGSGKYYVEMKADNTGTSGQSYPIGLIDVDQNITSSLEDNGLASIRASSGNIVGSSFTNQTGLTAVSAGDILAIAYDGVNGTLQFYRNGSTHGTAITGIDTSKDYYVACDTYEGSSNFKYNFGNGKFGTTNVSSAQNPDDGIGIFEFSPPTGYKALCTKSINAQEYS